MKKTLSLILALILVFSMGTIAFADDAVALTKDEAMAKAIAHVKYDSVFSIGTFAINDTYNDSIQGTVEVYNVTTSLLLTSGRTVTYNTLVDKYNGKIYYQKATFMDISSILELTEDRAYSLALETLGVNKDNTTVLSNDSVPTDTGKTAYHFVFVEGYSQKYECTVVKGDLAVITVDDIKVSKYNKPSTDSPLSGISGIIERIILAIKVLIAKLNPANLLDKISATDLLNIFKFLTK